MKLQRRDIKTKNKIEDIPVPIISDAAIGSRVIGDGRLIPLVILDTKNRPDIKDMIKMHNEIPAGDADISWGHIEKKSIDTITLILEFKRPIEALVCLEFSVARQGSTVDLILQSKALYIQAGVIGDTLTSTMDAERIVIEVPHTGFENKWDMMWEKNLIKHFRERGLSRKEAKLAAKDFIKSQRKLYSHRLRSI